MRRSRRFIKEHKLKPIANVDKEKREDKRGKGQRKYVCERERERECEKNGTGLRTKKRTGKKF